VARARSPIHPDATLDRGETSGRPQPDWVIGKHALLSLRTVARGGRTHVDVIHRRIPYQFQGVHYQDHDDEAFVFLHNSAGGFVEGDVAELHVAAGAATRTLLTTMGATKFYKSTTGGAATDLVTIGVGSGALLEYLPDEVIPFAGSRVRRATRVSAAPNARVILTDILSAGRIHFGVGEAFAFADLVSTLEVRRDGRVVFYDRLAVAGRDVQALRRLWQGRSHLVTVVVTGPGVQDGLEDAMESAACGTGTIVGASRRGDVICARVLAHETWQMHDAIERIWSSARQALAGKPGRPIRKC
jgi:urease accessory protein